MTKYSCGFAFDVHQNVALIRKKRPAWQAGKLNGVGGHVEDGENAHQAMIREFKEEAGLYVPMWHPLAILSVEDWTVEFFFAEGVRLRNARSMTDEEVVIIPAACLPPDVIHNLRWLIPLALDTEVMHQKLIIPERI